MPDSVGAARYPRHVPIRSENRSRYPADWRTISHRIRFERAAGRCECAGECGRPLDHLADDGRCHNVHGLPRWRGAPNQCVVVLTTAHLDHTPENVDDDNLLALCEGCHLHYDRAHHAQTRVRTRAAEMEAIHHGTLF